MINPSNDTNVQSRQKILIYCFGFFLYILLFLALIYPYIPKIFELFQSIFVPIIILLLLTPYLLIRGILRAKRQNKIIKAKILTLICILISVCLIYIIYSLHTKYDLYFQEKVIIRGAITDSGCIMDAGCTLVIDNKGEVITAGSVMRSNPFRYLLSIENTIDYNKIEKPTKGDIVEIYARKIKEDLYSVYGSKKYYIKIIN